MGTSRVLFDIYGHTIAVESTSSHLIHQIRCDFSFFRTDRGRPVFSLRAELESFLPSPPPRHCLVWRTSSWVCYRQDGVAHVYYTGDGYVRYDHRAGLARTQAATEERLHELVYLVLVSTAGELVERMGLHRIHGLGFTFRNRGVVYLAPMEGGKTTLALHLLAQYPIQLLSEDTPLLDGRGVLHPYPLRIGIRPEAAIPTRWRELPLRPFFRARFGSKQLLDIDHIQDRLRRTPILLHYVFVGRFARQDRPGTKVRPVSRLTLLRPLFVNLVLGIGVAQVKEYFIRPDACDLIRKAGYVVRRGLLMLRLCLRTHPCVVELGSDPAQSAEALITYLRASGPLAGKGILEQV